MNKSAFLEKVKSWIRPLYYRLYLMRIGFVERFIAMEVTDCKKIPIVINSYNRLNCLQLLIESLESRGYTNIHIIDNASSYPPLLEYLNSLSYPVYRLKKNMGYLALFKSKVGRKFTSNYFVYTDPDILPVAKCPDNFLEVFMDKMKSDSSICKVGFSLKIDDIPDYFDLKEEVIRFETQYYEKLENDGFYRANIDTTFALYRPGVASGANLYLRMYRSSYPYQARHLPWYNNSMNPSDEDMYYRLSATGSTHWTVMQTK